MFGKLLKHEFIDTWKIFLLLDAVVLALGVIVGIIGTVAFHIDDMPEPLVVLLTLGAVGYILLLTSLSVLTVVYIVVHFYRSMFSAQGYLTFTLPATTNEIISAKLLSSFIFQLLNSLCLFLSVTIAVCELALFGARDSIDNILHYINEIMDFLAEIFGMAPMTTVLYMIYALISAISGILIFYFAICLGQLLQKHRILGAVVTFFVTTTVIRVITTIIQLLGGGFITLYFEHNLDSGWYFTHIVTINTVISAIAAILMYLGCIFTTKHKLNLE